MINTVLEGTFKDFTLKLERLEELFFIKFQGFDEKLPNFRVKFNVLHDSENPFKSWDFKEQQSPARYVIEIDWDMNVESAKNEMERLINGKKDEYYINRATAIYNNLVQYGTKSTVVVDDEIFGFFNKYFFDRRTDLSEEEKQAILDEVRKQQTIEAMTRPAEKPAPVEHEPVPDNTPRCPICGSTNIRKIDGLERGTSVLMLGLFSKKINKTFKCKNCGHTW